MGGEKERRGPAAGGILLQSLKGIHAPVLGIGGCEEVKGFHILGAASRKARGPNERLCRGTESKRLADERVDLAGL